MYNCQHTSHVRIKSVTCYTCKCLTSNGVTVFRLQATVGAGIVSNPTLEMKFIRKIC